MALKASKAAFNACLNGGIRWHNDVWQEMKENYFYALGSRESLMRAEKSIEGKKSALGP